MSPACKGVVTSGLLHTDLFQFLWFKKCICFLFHTYLEAHALSWLGCEMEFCLANSVFYFRIVFICVHIATCKRTLYFLTGGMNVYTVT